MKKTIIALLMLISVNVFAQKDTTKVDTITVTTPLITISDLQEFVSVLGKSFLVEEKERHDNLIKVLQQIVARAEQRFYNEKVKKK